MYRPYSTLGIDTIVCGARLLATAQDIDPATMEGLIRKAARVAREAVMQDTRNATANDDSLGVVA